VIFPPYFFIRSCENDSLIDRYHSPHGFGEVQIPPLPGRSHNASDLIAGAINTKMPENLSHFFISGSVTSIFLKNAVEKREKFRGWICSLPETNVTYIC
jgi:hypothetical protein